MRSKIYTNVYKPKSREFIIDRELRFQTSKNSSKIRRAKLVNSARKFLRYGVQKLTTLASKYSTVVYKGICKIHSRDHFSSQSGNFSKKKSSFSRCRLTTTVSQFNELSQCCVTLTTHGLRLRVIRSFPRSLLANDR